MRRVAVVVASFALTAVACSLGALDGFSGGAPEGAAEAGADANAAPNDGGPSGTLDSGGEAGADGASSKTFCEALAQPARLCADFENGDVPLGFTTEQDQGGSAIIGATGKDGTKGLTSTVPSTAGFDASACILVDLPGPRTSLVIEVDFLAQAVGDGNFDIVNVDTQGNRELGVSMTGTALRIEEDFPSDGGEDSRETLASAQAKTTWQRLRLVMNVDGALANTELFIDGTSVAKHDAVGSTVADTTKLEIGDCTLVGADGWTVLYDNLVVYETK